MKKQAYIMMALLALMGSMAVAARAQGNGARQLNANIPFQFNVGDTTLPAGEYKITQVNPASDSAVLQIRSRNGGRTAMASMGSAIRQSADGTTLVFNRYGTNIFSRRLGLMVRPTD